MTFYKLLHVKRIEERVYGKFKDSEGKIRNHQITAIAQDMSDKPVVSVSLAQDSKNEWVTLSIEDFERIRPYFE